VLVDDLLWWANTLKASRAQQADLAGFFTVEVSKREGLPVPVSEKVAFVFGGSRSIGAASVSRLAQDGCAVAFYLRMA